MVLEVSRRVEANLGSNVNQPRQGEPIAFDSHVHLPTVSRGLFGQMISTVLPPSQLRNCHC
eukprot:3377918-Amphidinium_carterae.1